jgi:hypothetical protein
VRIAPPWTYHTYGLGLPLHRLIRDPLDASGRVEAEAPTGLGAPTGRRA